MNGMRHQTCCATIGRFADLAEDVGLTVTECVVLYRGKQINWLPNLRGSLAVFRLRNVLDHLH